MKKGADTSYLRRTNNLVEVRVHELVDEVYIVEIVSHVIRRAHNVPQRDNVIVVELTQDLSSSYAEVTMFKYAHARPA